MAATNYDTIISYANAYDTIPMFPVFEVSHYILMILAVRQDFQEGTKHLAQTNPLVCWFCSMLSSFAGGILANFLLGQPILAAFSNHINIGIATIVWYLIFYCPGDVFFNLVSSFPAQLLFIPFKEVIRMRKIAGGVAQAAAIYPSGFLVMLIIGTVKGTGSMQMRNIERLLRGTSGPSSNQLTTPSFTMKGSILISLLIVLQRYMMLPVPLSLLLLCCMLTMATVKVFVLYGSRDPFEPLEGMLRPVLFGKRPKDTTGRKIKDTKDGKDKKE
ncbi:trimeric intracellular cation channel type A-like [Patiria miniata]|uniref:Trimeric intracellular cation channel type B n=1 Tax=Patiria miniata TaxID=46514 RepID=A0A913ZXS9_PATMI|nr:trimeric intracellular cation channel type A-like [Patiria miniata]XP_038056303.1 trimeric intracellular cation channel type A-like [Patiria miniata]XP_038056304.1 trimeric intracellular cation channel type A-like [Patiria miniata]XP_038056305.1 trimeric intracellular cation channel type A-like [Patiria miniata]